MMPLMHEGSISIPVAVLAKIIENSLKPFLPSIAGVFISLSALLSCIVFLFKPKWVEKNIFAKSLLDVGPKWTMVRLTSAVFVQSIMFELGPEFIYSQKTGSFLLLDLLPVLVCVFLIAGLLLPLLLNFGLIEFFGVLLSSVMRPLFTLPGRSSIDCLASWIGDGTIGVLLTNKQYIEGMYTKREAAVIGTTFSLVSITFATVILSQVQLQSLFPQFYLTIFLAGIAAAVISPRIYPLNRIKDEYIDGTIRVKKIEKTECSKFYEALRQATSKASKNQGTARLMTEGIHNVLDMWLGVLPTVLCFGTCALILAEYTSLFDILGVPFVPLLEVMGVPDASAAASTILLGFADMFLPSVMISKSPHEFTRFVVACLSVSQLIYMSEVGSLLIGSKIPIKFKDLVLIYLQRTLISLPIIVACAHFIF
ncbi:MAG: YjiH family protein [Oligoflexales bacterium]